MDIAGGIAAATNALGIAKALRDVERSWDTVTYKQQIIDLVDALADAKSALIDAKEVISERDTEITRLKKHQISSSTLMDGDGGYQYQTNEAGERVGYPCCPSCLETEARVVNLKQDQVLIAAKCPICDRSYRPVTCYVPASENGGTETTTLAQFEDEQRIAHENMARRREAADRNRPRSSWMAR